MRRLSLLVFSLVSAVASAAAAAEGPPADDLEVVPPAELASHWTPASPPTPVPYPEELAARNVSGCVTLAYVIEPDGTTSGFRAIDAAASSRSPVAKRQAVEALARVSAAAVSTWRFTPVGEARRTLTATTVDFGAAGATAADQCANGDMARALQGGKGWRDTLVRLYEARWRMMTQRDVRPVR